jgi:hypothetical protein
MDPNNSNDKQQPTESLQINSIDQNPTESNPTLSQVQPSKNNTATPNNTVSFSGKNIKLPTTIISIILLTLIALVILFFKASEYEMLYIHALVISFITVSIFMSFISAIDPRTINNEYEKLGKPAQKAYDNPTFTNKFILFWYYFFMSVFSVLVYVIAALLSVAVWWVSQLL